jgi:membrane fusion protein, multidrug efflux system
VFGNENNALFPNQFVNIRLLVDSKRGQIVIPSVAIQHGQQGPFVFLVDEESKVKIQNITTDIVLDDNTTSIPSGLKNGDSVVVDGTDRLQDGTQVRIRTPGDEDVTGPGSGGGRGSGRERGKGKGRNGGSAPQ